MDNSTLRLATYVSRTEYANLAPEAVHECRRRIIDSVACAAAAYAEPFCATIGQVAGNYSGSPAARIWGHGGPTSMEMAGFANGTMVRYLDFSDTWLGIGAGHPSDMIPALVAVAEGFRRSGQELINAIVVAYEVYCGLCESALAKRALDQATAAAVGAAAGAGKLMGLDESRLADAISLALAPNMHLYNVRCGVLSDWKGCAGPNGARNGVFAATLAQAGVTGPTAPVQGKGGLQELIGAFDWKIGTDALPFITATHVKLHPVCYHGQSAIDAALELGSGLDVESIVAIEVEIYDAAFRVVASDPDRWAPSTRETADHSLPYTVAMALQEGRLDPLVYEDHRLGDPRTKQLMDKIRVSSSPVLTQAYPRLAPARMTIHSTGGVARTHLQELPRGHARNPVSDAEIETKFETLFSAWGDARAARSCLDVLWSVDRLSDVEPLVDALCPLA